MDVFMWSYEFLVAVLTMACYPPFLTPLLTTHEPPSKDLESTWALLKKNLCIVPSKDPPNAPMCARGP